MTLGNAAKSGVRLIAWCRACGGQVEPDPAEMAERYGAETAVPDGAIGLCVPASAAGRLNSCSPEPSDDEFLPVEAFGAASSRLFQGKRVCLTGQVRNYRGKLEIIMSDPSRLNE